MDKRHELRFATDQAITITVLGEQNTAYPARVKDISGRGLGIATAVPIRAGAAIAIEFQDSRMLGEVVYCRLAGDSFFLGVELQQVVDGLRQLRQLCVDMGFRSRTPAQTPPLHQGP